MSDDDKLKKLVFSELDPMEQRLRLMSEPSVPDPMSEAFAVSEKEREGHPINTAQWRRFGAWAFREFGEEAQLRNNALPWLSMDLYRSELEDLYGALTTILQRPMAAPFRLSRWERIKQWWLRSVWKRQHYAMLAAAREAFVEEYTRAGPWSNR